MENENALLNYIKQRMLEKCSCVYRTWIMEEYTPLPKLCASTPTVPKDFESLSGSLEYI